MKKKKYKAKQRKLSEEQMRVKMEEKLRAKTIPSKKKYNRKRKDKS